MRRRSTALALWLLATAVAATIDAAAAGVVLEAEVDRDQLFVGERFTLSLRFVGAQGVPAPDLSGIREFRVHYIGPMTRMESSGPRVSTSITHRYSLTAPRPGRFELGPFRIAYDGDMLEAQAIPIEVVQHGATHSPKQASSSEAGRLVLTVAPSKTQAYVGERVPLVVSLRVGDVRIDDLNYPEIAGEGFALDTLSRPAQRSEMVDGRRHQVLEFRTTLTALRAGELTVGPVTMNMDVLEANRGSRGDPLFDRFLGLTRRRTVELRADATALTIVPLPARGRPQDFSGAIGRFKFRVSATPTELVAGDPVAVRMEIMGFGNVASLVAPRVPAGDRFRAYDPLPAEGDTKPGRHVFEQVLIPRDADVERIPAVRFSYFDPEEGAYRTIVRGPIKLQVAAAAGAGRSEVVVDEGGGRREATRDTPLGRDIVYIKDRPGNLSSGSRADGFRLARSGLLHMLPVSIYAFLLYRARRRHRFGADPRLARFADAGRNARKELRALGAGARDGTAFYDRLTATVHGYLSAKLDLPPGAIERERVLGRLKAGGVGEALREQIDELLASMETTRYGGGAAGNGDHDAIVESATRIVSALERERSLAKRIGLFSIALVTLLTVAAGADAQGADDTADPMSQFFLGNTAYKEGRYEAAAQRYERIREAEAASGAVYFNLGNAYFKQDRVGPAIANYERARRLLPRDPDVTANLGYALEAVETKRAERPWWHALVFPLARSATRGELLALVAVAWWLMWIALSLRLLLPAYRIATGRVAVALAVVLVLAGFGALGRHLTVEGVTAAVIVVKQTAARFEPSDTGTEHFPLGEGALVTVRKRRDGWLQVRRADGLRGWIPEGSAEVL